MGSRQEVQVDVPESLRATPLPPMMLQTLVENAIKHGLEPRTGGGTVWIRARRDGDSVAVTVADDGNGCGGGHGGSGIGTKNVRGRQQTGYGGSATTVPTGQATTDKE